MPAELTLCFFYSFFLSFSVSVFFFLSFRFSSFFLYTPHFYFLIFKFSILSSSPCCCYCTQQGLLFIVPAVTGFYYFSSEPPLSGLGVLADHHVCVPLLITKQRGLFCLLFCRGTPFLLRCGCLLSPNPSWHAPSGPAQFCLFWWCVILTGHFPQKSLNKNLKIGLPFSPPPNHALLPLTHDLIVSCIGWVQASEIWALRVPSFHICLKSVCCSLVCRGLEVCLHSLPFVL